MIVPMKKVSLVVLNNERKDALLQLKKVGVVHLEQIDGSSEQLSLYKEASNNAVAANAILSDIKVAKKKSFSSAVKTLSNDEVVAKCKHVIDISDKKKKLLEEIASDKFDVIILNYANCDMVGHTGVIDAAVIAVKTVENCIAKITDAVLAKGGSCIITADHGNADKMIDDDGSPFTAHTTNIVPFILVSEQFKNVKLRDGGVLADVAPTLLEVMDEKQPEEMTGKSLIIK